MSFSNARNVDARNASFVEVYRDQINIASNLEIASQVLRGASALGATFDSADRYPPPECVTGTRENIIKQIIETMTGPNGSPICWLNGMAGSGKSAVAQSIADICANRDRLAASFFFSRATADHRNAHLLFPTIAYQLSVSIPSLKPFILGAMEKDLSIPEKALRYQFRKLIIDPLLQLPQPLSPPMIVVVDALDECEDQRLVADIIELLTEALVTFDLPLRFFLTSRPEPHIGAKFGTREAVAMTRSFALHEFDARNDIRIFLRRRLADVYAERRQVMRSIPQPWPTDHVLETLVRRSSGLFIFASTVFKYVDDKCHNPNLRLKEILDVDGPPNPSVYGSLDLLYLQIVSSVPDISLFQSLLGTIVCLFNPLSVEQLHNLYGSDRVDVSLILESLNSILLVPKETDKPVQVFHQSLRDFLIDSRRSSPYSINILTGHAEIASLCLDLMATELRGNGGVVKDPESATSGALQYAVDYWAAHFSRSRNDSIFIERLRKFGVESLLAWIEILRLRDRLDKALRSLRQAIGWLRGNSLLGWSPTHHDRADISFQIFELFHEAEQFIEYLSAPAAGGPTSDSWKIFRIKRRASRLVVYRSLSTRCQCGYHQEMADHRFFSMARHVLRSKDLIESVDASLTS